MMCCYYPTTTVAIDDDIDFLRIITQHLGIADCISYSSPSKAISSLKNESAFERIHLRTSKTFTSTEDANDSSEDYGFNVNLHRLHEEIYSQERFNDVSVLIIDYQMHEMNGIDVCKALIKHPAKKILLTGGMDREKIAIEAFNNGIIHRFINKTDPNFPTQLKQAVSLLKESYFSDLSTKLLPNISQAKKSLLHNPTYINFARNLQGQFNTAEHYLLDVNGSSLLLDAVGNPLWIIIKHESEIDNLTDIANNQEAPDHLINTLKNREMIPFFFSEEDYQQPASCWNEYLFPAYPVTGVSGYYYTTIHGYIKNNLIREKIISYSNNQVLKKIPHELQI